MYRNIEKVYEMLVLGLNSLKMQFDYQFLVLIRHYLSFCIKRMFNGEYFLCKKVVLLEVIKHISQKESCFKI